MSPDPTDLERGKWIHAKHCFEELLHTEGWHEFEKQLETTEARMIERLISSQKEEHDYLRGFIEGIRACFNLPAQVIDKVGKLLDKQGKE